MKGVVDSWSQQKVEKESTGPTDTGGLSFPCVVSLGDLDGLMLISVG